MHIQRMKTKIEATKAVLLSLSITQPPQACGNRKHPCQTNKVPTCNGALCRVAVLGWLAWSWKMMWVGNSEGTTSSCTIVERGPSGGLVLSVAQGTRMQEGRWAT